MLGRLAPERGEHGPAAIEHHRAGPEPAVGQLPPVKRGEGSGDIAEDGDRLAQGQGAAIGEPLQHRNAGWDGIDDPGPPLEFPGCDRGRDGWMGEHQQLIGAADERLAGRAVRRRRMQHHAAGRRGLRGISTRPCQEDSATTSRGLFLAQLRSGGDGEPKAKGQRVGHVGLVVITQMPRKRNAVATQPMRLQRR